MFFFKKIRKTIANRVLTSKIRTLKRERTITSINNADSIGIVFSTVNPEDYNHIKAFIAYINSLGIPVTPMVYIEGKKIPDYYHLNRNLIILTKKDLTWYGLPKEYAIRKFTKTPFHILIDLSVSSYLPVQYIVCLSNARFKIGRLIKSQTCYDLMIEQEGKNNNVSELIENIKYYTNILKSPY